MQRECHLGVSVDVMKLLLQGRPNIVYDIAAYPL